MKINKLIIIPVALLTTTLLTGVILSSAFTHADGNTSSTGTLSITVDSACTIKGGASGTDDSGSSTYTTSINAGNYTELSGSKLVTLCNDQSGYALYAIGYSGGSYDSQTHTDLIGTQTTGNIQTGTSGDNSYWAMKLEAVQGLTPPTIETVFQSYHVIPNTYTKIASYTTPTSTASDAGATVQTKYKINISKTQLAGSYTGKVKYTIVHPNTAPAPPPVNPPVSCTTPVPNLTYMQDLNSSNKASVLASMTEDSEYYLADKRDNKAYCVAKLKDGNIWMTQNLDHDIKTDGSVTYDPTTTDVPSTWTPSAATYPTGTTTWNNSIFNPESYNPGELYWSGTLENNTPVSNGNSHYHLGNYYNWTAAIAMNDSSSYTTQYQDVNQSICPVNWTLPKGGDATISGSFEYLVTKYGWNSSSKTMANPNIWNSPIKASLGGYWYGSLEDVGHGSYFWSPMVYDNDYSYTLYATSTGYVRPDYRLDRYSGFSVRCLAR